MVEPFVPPRSRLYSLQPCGSGTAYVESLTSYTARLGHTHGLTVRQLVGGEIWPLFGLSNQQIGSTIFAASICKDDARALSGTRRWAGQWVAALEALTQRTDLRFSTMLPWANVLSNLGLLRPERAWCPACYQAWREANQIIYDPLLWSVQEITICTLHQRPLQFHCPNRHCQRSQPYLANRIQLGHCVYCGIWLGLASFPKQPNRLNPNSQENQWKTWVAEAIGELLVSAPSLSVLPQQDRIGYATTLSLQQITDGKTNELARQIGRDASILGTLLVGDNVPRLGTLLRLSYVGGVQPLQFLTQTPLRLNPIRHSASKPLFQSRPVKIVKHDNAAYLQALERTLKCPDPHPPSMREMGRRLGCDPHYLYRHFPQQSKAVSQRYLAFREAEKEKRAKGARVTIRNAVLAIHRRGEFPSRHRVGRVLNLTIFGNTPMAAVWREAIQELGLVERGDFPSNTPLSP